MKQMTSAEIRQAFLDYFAKQGHQVVASSSLVPGNDPTLLFTNAGMVQFKDVFLGIDNRPYVRATSSQKCMRISGKHNDLENVGPSPRHHTFFEMLGNFSFGDYFKRDAIRFAYELLTEVYGLPADRLAYTVYREDDEAYDIWTKEIGVSPKRVARMGPKTNFWQMADTGPCGPTSEVHWDLTPEAGEDTILDALQREDDRFLELWNLVFMQYNRTQADPGHSGQYDDPLPAPGVDTGLGLERISVVLQGGEANYDTDLFQDIMDATQEVLGHDDDFRQEHYVAYRVIADHMRAASFLIADGVNPGTSGREYVTRMLIRRALRFAHGMDVDRQFLADVALAVIHKMSGNYPELDQFQEAIRYQISTEEGRFSRMLVNSLAVLNDEVERMKADKQTEMDGHSAFDLYQTHGLPLEITRDILREHGMTVDEAGFREAQDEHRDKSKTDLDEFEAVEVYQMTINNLKDVGELPASGVVYDPYDYDALGNFNSTVLAILSDGKRVKEAKRGQPVEIVLANTAFYVESGGQVSDTGVLTGEGWEVQVRDMHRPIGGLILHIGEVTRGTVQEGSQATGSVDAERRWDIMRNHTATHLLHAALRQVLGEHVRQKGSLVAPDRLRFDFTHNAKVTDDEARRITQLVSEMVLANRPVEIVHKSLDEAKREGAMALFGEKYGAEVRTVTIPGPDNGVRYSYELCGGTHVRWTGDIGPFILTSEDSASAGVRRIEAITGHGAQSFISDRLEKFNAVTETLGGDAEIVEERLQRLQAELNEAQSRIKELERDTALETLDDLLAKAEDIDGFKLVAAEVEAPDGDMLGQMADWCRDRIDSGVVVLGSAIDGKARLVAKVTQDVVKRGVHAGNLVGALAKQVGGGGGGRPDFATAGGKDIDKIGGAIASARALVEGALK